MLNQKTLVTGFKLKKKKQIALPDGKRSSLLNLDNKQSPKSPT